MTRRLIVGALLVVTAALALHDLVGMAQGVMTPPGKFVASAQWKKMLDDDKPALGIVAGQAVRIVEPFVIRPGTAHWFSKINGHVTYLEARFPGNVLAPPAR